MSKILIALLILTGLSACAGNTKQLTCTGQDWKTLGYNTAKEGKNIHTFDSYTESCGDKLDSTAKAAYIDGYTKGIIEFCTYDNGYQYGSNNLEDPNICPYEVRAVFVKGYKKGALDLSIKMRLMKNATTDRPDRTLDEKPTPKAN